MNKFEESRKKSGMKVKPWCVHPEVNKADWINDVFQTLWPCMRKDLNNLMEHIFEKITQESFSPGIESCILEMGEAPKVVGIKTLKVSDRRKIIVDIFVEHLCSDSVIQLSLFTKWKLPKCSFNLQRLDVMGTFRLEFNLTDTNGFPEISKVFLSSIEIPEVHISFGVASWLLFIDHLISYFIDQFMEEFLKFPNRFELYNDINKSQLNPKLPQGVINILIQEAKNLSQKDWILPSDVSDPYTILSFSVDSKNYNYQTQVVIDDLSPKWNYICQVPVEDIQTISNMSFTVMDKDSITKDDFLGSCNLPSNEIIKIVYSQKPYEKWKKLYVDGKYEGKIKLFISFSPILAKIPRTINISTEGLLTVYIDSCQNLCTLNNRHPHWRAKSTVGNTVAMSKRMHMSSDPVFKEKLFFIVKNPRNDKLLVNLVNVKNNYNGGTYETLISEIVCKNWLISQILQMDLHSNNLQGQTKDPKISIACEYREIYHSGGTLLKLEFISGDKIIHKSFGEATKEKIASLIPNSIRKVEYNKHCLLNVSVIYKIQNSSLSINILTIENAHIINSANHNIQLKIKLNSSKQSSKTSISIDSREINHCNQLMVEKNFVFKLKENGVKDSRITVSNNYEEYSPLSYMYLFSVQDRRSHIQTQI